MGWVRTIVPAQDICTDPATIQTSTSFPRQARPARYMVPANDTCPPPSTMRVTTIPVLAAPGGAPALARHRSCGVGFTALHVGGDQHVVVIDLHQVVGDHRLDRLAGQHDGDPIPEASQPDQPALIDPALHPGVT